MRKLTDKNRLSIINPELCKEWNYKRNRSIKPENVSFGSSKKVWWICKKCKCEWESTISHRSNDRGCPYCAGKKVSENNQLATLYPQIIKLWDNKKNFLTPYEVTLRSGKKVWLICKNGHSYEITIAKISEGRGCPYCRNKRTRQDNCLATTHPNLCKEWNYKKNTLTPNEVVAGSEKKAWWKCKKGHEWETIIYSRTTGKTGCPYCASQKVCDSNCLAVHNPLLSTEWHPTKNGALTAYNFTRNSGKKVWWRCKNGHEWMATIDSRHHNGCSKCGKIELKDGEVFDSLCEAYYYLKLKGRGILFIRNKEYGFKRKKYRFDFYIPKLNTYIEITGYNRKGMSYSKMGRKVWKLYLKKISIKRNFVNKILRKKFRFIKIKLNKNQLKYIRKNIK